MELAEIVGNNIRFFRKRKGWSQKDLIRALPSITQSRISLIERGGKMITLKTLEQVSGVLGVAPYELLINRHVGMKRKASELAKLFDQLPKKDRDALSVAIDAALREHGLIN